MSRFDDRDKGGENNKRGLRSRLALSTALAALFMGGYGTRATHAGECLPGVIGGTYFCTGGADAFGLDSTQALPLSGSTQLTVSTTGSFGIDTSNYFPSGNALTLIGTGGLAFTDNFSADITGALSGIFARNYGAGALTVTSTGVVTGNAFTGIFARNTSSGTNLTVSAATVYGATVGLYAHNFGSGALSVTASGLVSGSGSSGIYALNGTSTIPAGTSLSVSAASVISAGSGINARNFGSVTSPDTEIDSPAAP